MTDRERRIEEIRTELSRGISRRMAGLLESTCQSTGVESADSLLLDEGIHISRRLPMAKSVFERALRIRIATGFGLIVLLTILIAVWSYFAISTLGTSAEQVFRANYRSIQYAHVMEESLVALRAQATDSLDASHSYASNFREAIAHEEANITEPGELRVSNEIRTRFENYYSRMLLDSSTQADADSVASSIQSMLDLNERGMFRRANWIKHEAEVSKYSTLAITSVLLAIAILLALAVSRRSLSEFLQLDRAKNNFVSTAAHELKNPLSTIKTSSNLLLDGVVGKISESQAELVHTIQNESERLLHLVRELLDLARIDAGTFKLNRQTTQVDDLIVSAIMPVAMLASKSDVEIEIIHEDLIPYVLVDSNKIVWALSNLLSNAIKYSPRNSTVTIEVKSTHSEVALCVTDHGRGISSKDFERIFQRFVQVENSEFGRGNGSGLGLSIAKDLVTAHGGDITLISKIGSGSTFTILLPKSKIGLEYKA